MFIKDIDCTKDTPVVQGKPDTPIKSAGMILWERRSPVCTGKTRRQSVPFGRVNLQSGTYM